MPSADLRDQIEQLEIRIEALAETAERCRKIMLFAKVVIVAGGAVMLAVVAVGPTRFDPTALIGGMAAVIGGIVVFGSNRSTMEQTLHAMRSAEAERRELIGQVEMRVVE